MFLCIYLLWSQHDAGEDAARVDAQLSAEQLVVEADVRLVVATISVDVECCVVSFAIAALSGGAEGYHSVGHIVKVQECLHRAIMIVTKVPDTPRERRAR